MKFPGLSADEKKEMQKEIRQLMTKHIPDLVITDVFVEPIPN